MISVCYQGTSLNLRVIQVYDLISNAEEEEVGRFYEDIQELLEVKPKKVFIIEDWNANVKKYLE